MNGVDRVRAELRQGAAELLVRALRDLPLEWRQNHRHLLALDGRWSDHEPPLRAALRDACLPETLAEAYTLHAMADDPDVPVWDLVRETAAVKRTNGGS
jgi:hypothetical protein